MTCEQRGRHGGYYGLKIVRDFHSHLVRLDCSSSWAPSTQLASEGMTRTTELTRPVPVTVGQLVDLLLRIIIVVAAVTVVIVIEGFLVPLHICSRFSC